MPDLRTRPICYRKRPQKTPKFRHKVGRVIYLIPHATKQDSTAKIFYPVLGVSFLNYTVQFDQYLLTCDISPRDYEYYSGNIYSIHLFRLATSNSQLINTGNLLITLTIIIKLP